MRRRAFAAVIGFAALTSGAPSLATTITLSDVSSDATPASTLDATLDFSVIGGNTLQLVLTNNTSGSDLFDINEVFWNASANVSGLTLTSATHSVKGNVTKAWSPVETGAMVNGFGVFDFGLTDGVGAKNPNVVQPGNNVTFVMTISGPCATALNCVDADFIVGNLSSYLAAAKFVNGPDDPESPGIEDSAYGAAIPEPSTVLLVGLGLIGLARQTRRD